MGEVRRKDPRAEHGLVFGLLAAGRGIGAVSSGPLSGALLKGRLAAGGIGAYGGRYGPLVVFTGITAAVGGVGWMGRVVWVEGVDGVRLVVAVTT